MALMPKFKHDRTLLELLMRIELTTSSLPRKCSTPELQQQDRFPKFVSGTLVNGRRAADEVRTRDIQLGRLTLYQLSYHRSGKKEVSVQKGENTYMLLTFFSAHFITKCGGGGIRTYSAVKHQIYSLARLSDSGAPPWNF